MKIKEAASLLSQTFALHRAEDFDNVGLLCGDPERKLTGFLVCHDALEDVVLEAAEKGLNMVVAFHPIIFSGLKNITSQTYVGRAVLRALEHKVAIFAVHTAFDNDNFGVNFKICETLGLQNQKILMPKKNALSLLNVYVPAEHSTRLKNALFAAGAGNIGNYDECSFSVKGEGTFRPLPGSDPFSGTLGVRENAGEEMVSVIFEAAYQQKILSEMRANHPYEEVAYQIHHLENENHHAGLGRFGELAEEMSVDGFLNLVKEKFGLKVIRFSGDKVFKIKKIGVLGGSGSGGIKAAASVGCDAYLTGDLKYHDFFSSEGKMLLCDIGHYESEQFVVRQMVEKISENFPKFAVAETSVKTNPVNYFL